MSSLVFRDYRLITARYSAICGRCGKPIGKGESLAYVRRGASVYCADCYDAWSNEVGFEDLGM